MLSYSGSGEIAPFTPFSLSLTSHSESVWLKIADSTLSPPPIYLFYDNDNCHVQISEPDDTILLKLSSESEAENEAMIYMNEWMFFTKTYDALTTTGNVYIFGKQYLTVEGKPDVKVILFPV